MCDITRDFRRENGRIALRVRPKCHSKMSLMLKKGQTIAIITLRDCTEAICLPLLVESHLVRDLANRAPDILVEFRARATPRRMP